MQRINDRLILGLIAGLGANLIKEAIGDQGGSPQELPDPENIDTDNRIQVR